MITVQLNRGYSPKNLIDAINRDIEVGTIQTWQVDSDGDYTPVQDQWRNHAWIRYRSLNDGTKMKFGIVEPGMSHLKSIDYAVFHGRFAEMLLFHYDKMINSISLSSMLDPMVDVYKH